MHVYRRPHDYRARTDRHVLRQVVQALDTAVHYVKLYGLPNSRVTLAGQVNSYQTLRGLENHRPTLKGDQ